MLFEVNQTKLDRLLRKSTEPKAGTSSAMHTCSGDSKADPMVANCFFCNGPAGSASLHEASIYSIDFRIRKCPLELEATDLLAKLAPGDMIPLEAKYHCKCLIELYNRARPASSSDADDDPDGHLHGIAFAELVAYMEDFHAEGFIAPVFKLANLAQMYKAIWNSLVLMLRATFTVPD